MLIEAKMMTMLMTDWSRRSAAQQQRVYRDKNQEK